MAVQPPGYGLDAGPAGPPPVPERAGSGPEVPGRPEDPGRPAAARRVAVAGIVVVALVLVVGAALVWAGRPRYVDTAAVEAVVGAELSERLGGPVAVDCPAGPERRAGATLDCTAADGTSTRTVRVTLTDGEGRYRWELIP